MGATASSSATVGRRFSLELELGKAAGHADELAVRRALGLLADQVQPFLQAVDTVPADLEIIVDRTANRMGVAVVQAGDHPLAAGIDHLGEGADQAQHLIVRADRCEHTALSRERGRFRAPRIHGGDAAVQQHQIGGARQARRQRRRLSRRSARWSRPGSAAGRA